MFVWDKVAVQKAKILADLGYSASETAEVIGVGRNSCISRARRLGEFRFKARSGGFTHRPEYIRKRVEEARKAVEHITRDHLDLIGVAGWNEPQPSPLPPKPDEPPSKMSAVVVDRRKTPKKQKHRGPTPYVFRRTDLEPDKPVTSKALKELLKPYPVNKGSILMIDAGLRNCRWIVGKVKGADTKVCGKRTHQAGEPYCEHHEKLSRSGRKMRKITEEKINSFDQNIKPVAPMTTESSSAPKKS